MNLCLVVQKDTFDKATVGSVLSSTNLNPDDFVKELQSHHCIEYQLIAHTQHSPVLETMCREAAQPYKADFGRDWYRFDQKALSQIISFFLESGTSVINLRSVNQIFGFSVQIFPIVDREVVIRPVKNNDSKGENKAEPEENSNQVTKDEIATIIEDLSKADAKKSRDKRERRRH